MRRITFLTALVLSLALAVALLPGSKVVARPAAATVEVAAADFEFQPKTVTINVGDTITWTNTGQRPHTATASDGSWDSGNLDSGQTFSQTFNTAGTFAYYCEYHGSAEGAGMAGTIVVQAQQAQPTATTEAQPTATTEAQPQPTTPAEPTATAPAQTGPTPAIEASDQPVTNNMVTVSRVVAAQDGWVVIHTNTAENQPGPVIGQTHVTAGEHQNVQVQLSQTPNVGDKLWPMLHIDAGTAGTYEFPGADVPATANGDVVMVQIAVTQQEQATPAAQPAIEASNQPVTNNMVTVSRVVAAQDGWVVIHTNTAENRPGPVIGQTHVTAGEHQNVQVQLSQTPNVGDRLWPMLHIDAGTAGTYEFPGADVPVTANGDVVMVQITVTGGAPAELPRTGPSGDSSLWLVAVLGLALLLAGALLRRRIA